MTADRLTEAELAEWQTRMEFVHREETAFEAGVAAERERIARETRRSCASASLAGATLTAPALGVGHDQ